MGCYVSSVGEETTAIHEHIRGFQKQKDAIYRKGPAAIMIPVPLHVQDQLEAIQAGIRQITSVREKQRDNIDGPCSMSSSCIGRLDEQIIKMQQKQKELTNRNVGEVSSGNLENIQASIVELDRQRDAIRSPRDLRWIRYDEKIVELQNDEKKLTDAVRAIDEQINIFRAGLI